MVGHGVAVAAGAEEKTRCALHGVVVCGSRLKSESGSGLVAGGPRGPERVVLVGLVGLGRPVLAVDFEGPLPPSPDDVSQGLDATGARVWKRR